MSILSVQDISKTYKLRKVVKSLSLEIKSGEVVGLLGPNGAGKTTALRILSTVLKPTQGTAIINGFDILRDPAKVRHQIGFVSSLESLWYQTAVNTFSRWVSTWQQASY